MMNNISFKEDHISQIPALQLLQKLGYTYLSQEEALELRGCKATNVLLMICYIPLTFDDMDVIIDQCVNIAKLWYK